MMIITLHQPYATLIAMGIKKYETRHWRTPYRGELLIHAASKKMTRDDKYTWLSAIDLAKSAGLLSEAAIIPDVSDLPHGDIIAVALLNRCLKMYSADPDKDSLTKIIPSVPLGMICIQQQTALERSIGGWEAGRFAFQMTNVRPLTKGIPFTSRQGKLLPTPQIIADMIPHLVAA